MSETEITGGPPVVKWMRGTSGTISVAPARVKGEGRVEIAICEAGGKAQVFVLSESDARTLALRIHSVAVAGTAEGASGAPASAEDIAVGYARWAESQSPAGRSAE